MDSWPRGTGGIGTRRIVGALRRLFSHVAVMSKKLFSFSPL